MAYISMYVSLQDLVRDIDTDDVHELLNELGERYDNVSDEQFNRLAEGLDEAGKKLLRRFVVKMGGTDEATEVRL